MLKSLFKCIVYCYMQMIALYFRCWRAYSLISYIVTCRWLYFTFPAEELLQLYHILLHADDCLKLSLLRASSLVSYIVKCRWLPYFPCWRSSLYHILKIALNFPCWELLHLYHILLHADDCLILSLLKILFTCIWYCSMQMIALYFPCWRSSSRVSYIVTCRWLPSTFPAEEQILLCRLFTIINIVTCRWLYHADDCLILSLLKSLLLLHADDCLKLSLLKSLFTCIVYCYSLLCRWLPYTFLYLQMIALYFSHWLKIIAFFTSLVSYIDFPCWRASSLVSYIVTCRWLPYTFPAEDLLHLYHILLHADDCLTFPAEELSPVTLKSWRATLLVSYIVTCRWFPYTFPAEELLHLYHILLHADDCLILSPLKIFFTCIIYCYMQMIALIFHCWRTYSLVSYIVICRWLPYTFPAEELIHLYHILLHADDCTLLSLLKNYFTCIIYCYMQMIALNFPCWELLHLYHILLNADDCLIHSLLKIFFTCIIYCYMQTIALYFPCWRASSLVSYIVTCRWLPYTFPAEELLHLYHILLHADDCLLLSLLKSYFTCIIYCYMQMIALYFPCWRAYSLVSNIVACRWLPYSFPAEELLHLYHILLHADDCLKLSVLKSLFKCIVYCYMQMIALYFRCWRAYSLVSYIVTCRWLFFTFPAEDLLHLYHILLHADDCLNLSLLKSLFTCIIYCYMQMIALYFPCWRAYSLISYIVTCRWLYFTFPAEELLHLYHILLHADDCLKLSLLRASSLVSYIVKCRWLPYTFPAEDLLHLYHILLHAVDCLKLSLLRASSLASYIVKRRWLPYTFTAEDLLHLYLILFHADDCLILSLLKIFFTCIIYCYMQMIAFYFPCWRATSLVSYIVTCRWLPYTFPAEELIHWYQILLHADYCLIVSLLKSYFTCIIYCYMQMIALNFQCWRAYSRVSYIVTCRWLPYTFSAEELIHLYHILLHADDCFLLSLLKNYFTCIVYC